MLFSRVKKQFYLLFFLLPIGTCAVFAQQTTVYTTPYADFNLAMELFDKEKFGAAQNYFEKVASNFSGQNTEVGINAKYYSALCALELFNKNAENLLIAFINEYPENPKTKIARFQLGKYWFRKRHYRNAIVWFEKVSIYDLDNSEIAEYYFKLGYAYFIEEKNNKALKAFYEIKDADTRFTSTARYYYAHLSYLDKKYETALIDFKKIEKNTKFSVVVPYYIAQIYFLQEKYDTLLSYALPLLDSANTKRTPEIARLIGEAYYHTGRYEEAIPFLKKYQESVTLISETDAYELGYAYFKSKHYGDAIEWFKKSTNGSDSLAQIAYYHMAECYLQLDNKKFARNGLLKASRIGFDEEIKEDALFSFAKLAYELSYHPYNDAIHAFEDYINTYPNSSRIDRAHEYLIGVYYTTKNYKEALKSLDRIKNRSYKLDKAYQKVTYLRGIELFTNRDFPGAIEHFKFSLTKDFDQKISLSCLYWIAEAWYRQLKYNEAISAYQEFLTSPGAISNENYNLAYYGKGYAYYRKKDYVPAITAFRNFVRNDKEVSKKLTNDALLRIADCYFISKKYNEAIEYYDKAVLLGEFETDYSLFQSGVANGVVGNYDEKINLLMTLTNGYASSSYQDDALFELGETYLISNKNEEALQYFDEVITKYPNSSYVGKAKLKKGLIYYNKNEDAQALAELKGVIEGYKGTKEASDAIEKVKKIYTDQGDMIGFQTFLTEVPEAELSKTSLDSTLYEIAENNYMSGACEEATKNFTAYLEKGEDGIFATNAHFYRAECEYKAEYFNEALLDYDYILKQPKNKFTEQALLKAAVVHQKLDDVESAMKNYIQLEELAEIPSNKEQARYWLSKLSYDQNLYEEAIRYGLLVLKNDKLDEYYQEEIQMLIAHSYFNSDDFNKSFEFFDKVSNRATAKGAEAKYNKAYIEYLRGKYVESEELVMEVVNQIPAFDFWIAKGFLLLADKYLAENDAFQAKYTLQSVLDNFEGDDLRRIAQEKLDKIIDEEEQERKRIEAENDQEIIIDNTEDDYDYLFEEEVFEENLENE